jgi:outer membrane cobalamin receptor
MKSNRFYILLLLFLFVFVAVGQAARAATLEGMVLDPSGQAVPNARVSLIQSLVTVGELQADARGAYRFADVEGGAYQLVASSPGLSSPAMDIVLANAEAKRQDIHLEISALASQVVVSASLGGALVPQIGSSLSLIDRQEIEDRATQNIVEVLRGVPGTEVSQAGRRGGVTGIYIRGGESNYNAVLIDGIPMNDFGGAFDTASLPADGIEKVEFIRGPESALYGSNAVTGVINLISSRGEGPPRFTVMADGGTYETRRFAVGGSGLTRGLSWSFNLSRLDSNGAVVNDRYRNQSAFLSLGYRQGNRRQLDFHFFGNANDAGAPGPYGSEPIPGLFPGIDTISRGKRNLFGYQVGYTEQFSSRVRQVTTASFATNDLFYHMPWNDMQSDSLRGLFNTRSEISISSNDTLAVGFEFNREQIKNTYLTDGTGVPFDLPRTSLAFFAENRWNPFSRMFVTAGVRVDNLRTSEINPDPAMYVDRPLIPANSIVKVNPRISAAYIAHDDNSDSIFGRTRIHGSYGTGIRPPDVYNLAFTNNPALKPEQSSSFDAGFEQGFFSSHAIADFTYFYSRFHDQIVTLGGSLTNLSSYRSDNLNNSRAQGVEITFRVRPIQSLELSGQYTFVDSEILALDGSSLAKSPFEVGQPLLRRPRNAASYSITWQHRRLTLSTNAYLRGIVLDTEPNWGASMGFFDNKGYVRADIGFSYRLQHGIELYGRLNNFLNQKYEEVFGYPSLPLNFVAGMKFSFSAE